MSKVPQVRLEKAENMVQQVVEVSVGQLAIEARTVRLGKEGAGLTLCLNMASHIPVVETALALTRMPGSILCVLTEVSHRATEYLWAPYVHAVDRLVLEGLKDQLGRVGQLGLQVAQAPLE